MCGCFVSVDDADDFGSGKVELKEVKAREPTRLSPCKPNDDVNTNTILVDNRVVAAIPTLVKPTCGGSGGGRINYSHLSPSLPASPRNARLAPVLPLTAFVVYAAVGRQTSGQSSMFTMEVALRSAPETARRQAPE